MNTTTIITYTTYDNSFFKYICFIMISCNSISSEYRNISFYHIA